MDPTAPTMVGVTASPMHGSDPNRPKEMPASAEAAFPEGQSAEERTLSLPLSLYQTAKIEEAGK